MPNNEQLPLFPEPQPQTPRQMDELSRDEYIERVKNSGIERNKRDLERAQGASRPHTSDAFEADRHPDYHDDYEPVTEVSKVVGEVGVEAAFKALHHSEPPKSKFEK